VPTVDDRIEQEITINAPLDRVWRLVHVAPAADAVRVTVVESGFAALDVPESVREQAWKDNTGGWESELASLRERAESA
jgi:hypothetical protein